MHKFVKIVDTWKGNNLEGPETKLPDDLPKEVIEVEAETKEEAERKYGAPIMTIKEYKGYQTAKKESYGTQIREYRKAIRLENLKLEVGFFKRLWLKIKPHHDLDSGA